MNIHLVRSSEIDDEFFENVLEIIGKNSGPINFIQGASDVHFSSAEIKRKKFNEEKFGKLEKIIVEEKNYHASMLASEPWPPEYPNHVEIVSWDSIFEKCNDYRTKNKISDNDSIILLTAYSNDKNWFSAWDRTGRKNGFVHTGHWEYFLPCDPRFPVAYQVMEMSLQSVLFPSYKEALSRVHRTPRGCINDFCEDKKQVTLKLRTADICPDCQELLVEMNVDARMIDQVLRTLDDIRSQMLFRERYKTTLQPSRLEIRGPLKRIFFTDIGDTELKLTPLERIVYLLFLNHPDGLRLNEISDHREWIEKTYREIGNSRTVAEFRNSIDQLIDPTENSLSEKMSKIRRKIFSLVGEELGEHYIIEGERDDKKRIRLDRRFVK